MNEFANYPVLMVDDEPNVLAGYRRTLGRAFNVTCAEGAEAGLAAIAAASANPFAVVISDMRMPKMNGIEFITAARPKTKDSIFLMLTGNADQQTPVEAINQGQVFRFLTKPCTPPALDAAVRAALRQYELVTAERVLLRDTFTGSIKFMTEALELANPKLFALQGDVRQLVQQTCTAVGVKCDWQLLVAASLCLIGLMTLPTLADEELTEGTLTQSASAGGRLLGHIPRIGLVVSMIRRQRDALPPLSAVLTQLNADGQELFGAHVLRFCVDLAIERRRTPNRELAIQKMIETRRHDARFTNAFLTAAQAITKPGDDSLKEVRVKDLQPGMVLAKDAMRSNGALIFAAGQPLSELAVERIRTFVLQGLSGDTVFISADLAAPAAGRVAA